jgi:hypothetical protein
MTDRAQGAVARRDVDTLTSHRRLPIFGEMSLDLNDLLDGWPHEPGQVKVRKISGRDGSEKLQLRIDLGVIQMELSGRPDGVKPEGFESLLQLHRRRADEAEKAGESYELDEEECAALHQEGIQYYHRYIALMQIEDFEGVIRDTARNLELFDFVSAHAGDPEVASSFEQFRPYVLMMNARARASLHLGRGDMDGAVESVDAGKQRIREALDRSGRSDQIAECPEIQFLSDWIEEVTSDRPLSPLQKMEREMARAIAEEAYERAAELRDAIRALRTDPR